MDKKFKLERWQLVAILMAIYDILAVNISYLFTLWIRFDFRFRMIPKWYMGAWRSFAPIYTIFCIVVFALLHMYRSIWRFASFSELGRVFLSSVVSDLKSCSSADRSACPHIDHQVVSSSRTVIRKR